MHRRTRPPIPDRADHRRVQVASLALGAVLAAIVVVALRVPLLRTAGSLLVVNHGLQKADVIVIGVGADDAGVLEASDLVRDGWGARVVIVKDSHTRIEREFRSRGMLFEEPAARSAHQLQSLGVPAEVIPTPVTGSEDEGLLLSEWSAQNKIHSMIVVTTRDHTRRLTRILRRSMTASRTRWVVRGAECSVFDPDRWWDTRAGVRIELVESQKLILDLLRHPLS